MLLAAAEAALANPSGSSESLKLFLQNAPVEAFALHLRNLLHFLYPEDHRVENTDVVATDFFDSEAAAAAWRERRGPMSATMVEAKHRAHRQVAHLTVSRIEGTPPEKGWKMGLLLQEIIPLLITFAESADPSRLHPRVLSILTGDQ